MDKESARNNARLETDPFVPTERSVSSFFFQLSPKRATLIKEKCPEVIRRKGINLPKPI